MKILRLVFATLAIGVASISTAQARDSFSLGINIGGYPYYAPPPVYYAAPPVVYYREPVYYAAPTVYYYPQTSFAYYGYGGHRHHHGGGNNGYRDRGDWGRGDRDRGDWGRGRGHGHRDDRGWR